MSSGEIEITRRADGWTDRLRSYAVFVDGDRVGTVARGTSWSATLDPGAHTVQLRLDYCQSPTVSVEVVEGETARLSCFARSPLAALYYSTIGRKRYIGLERSDG
jgi:hypothetical protein